MLDLEARPSRRARSTVTEAVTVRVFQPYNVTFE